MEMQIFSVFDNKAELYGTPVFKLTIAEAIRDFKDVAGNKETTIGRHPGDFKLCKIGQFDMKTGEVKPFSPVTLAHGDEHGA